MRFNFSIIIPHKNIPRLLNRCLESIPQRDDIQIIVIDDNSNPSIVDFNSFPGYNAPNTSVHFSKEGKGAGYVRNIGLSLAQGKWIIFADADDFFTNDFSSVLDFYKDADEDVVLFPIKTVNSDSLKDEEREPYFNQTVFNTTYSNREKLACTSTPWSKLIKKSLIDNNNISFDEIPYSNDILFSTKVAIAAYHITVDTHRYIYTLTVRSGSLMTIKDKAALFCRLQTSIRTNIYLKEHNHAEWMQQLNGRYLKWASQLGKKEVMLTIFILLKNGFLFYKGKYAWKNKYYNDTWYLILHAVFCRNKK